MFCKIFITFTFTYVSRTCLVNFRYFTSVSFVVCKNTHSLSAHNSSRKSSLQKWQESRTIIYMFKDLLEYLKNIHKLNNLWLVNPRNNSCTRWCSYQFTVITLATVFLGKTLWIFYEDEFSSCFRLFFKFFPKFSCLLSWSGTIKLNLCPKNNLKKERRIQHKMCSWKPFS